MNPTTMELPLMGDLFSPPSGDIQRTLDSIPALIDEVFPLPKRFRLGLSRDVAELSRLLTNGRGDRNESYLGEPRFLSAYLRYFLPWNLCRLSRLLPNLPLPLSAGSAITDLGSGPLTLPIALWISRPDLRGIPLEFRCLDRTGAVLEAGRKLFLALTGAGGGVKGGDSNARDGGRDSGSSNAADAVRGNLPVWTIKTIKASIGEPVRFPRADLVTAVNLFNELFWKISWADHRALSGFAEKNARLLSGLALEGGSVLVVEPGVPRCGEFISLLRTGFSDLGRKPLAPCPHDGVCPLPGTKGAKWCHFAFDTGVVPETLRRLSEAAGFPKERAALSFLLAGPAALGGGLGHDRADPGSAKTGPAVPGPVGLRSTGVGTVSPSPAISAPKDALTVRIVSDAFPLGAPGTVHSAALPAGEKKYGRYGCSGRGLVLVAGKRRVAEELESGAVVTLTPKTPEQRDGKSGAIVVNV